MYQRVCLFSELFDNVPSVASSQSDRQSTDYEWLGEFNADENNSDLFTNCWLTELSNTAEDSRF
jgi:hypothetical protein